MMKISSTRRTQNSLWWKILRCCNKTRAKIQTGLFLWTKVRSVTQATSSKGLTSAPLMSDALWLAPWPRAVRRLFPQIALSGRTIFHPGKRSALRLCGIAGLNHSAYRQSSSLVRTSRCSTQRSRFLLSVRTCTLCLRPQSHHTRAGLISEWIE